MGNSSTSLLKTVLAWVIVVAVAIFAFKVLIAIVAGLVQTFFAIALLVLIVLAVVWAMRRL
jgi:hypothetical protein